MRKILAALLVSASILSFANNTAKEPHYTQKFIHMMAPLAIKADKIILKNRERLLAYYQIFQSGKPLGTPRWEWMAGLADYYGLKSPDFSKDSTWKALLNRANIIPPSLVIAQAAIESAWGKSRFAKEANNFFGQHCYKAGCGLMPKQRPKGQRFLVEKFPTPFASVKSYMHNINTHYNYADLRALRTRLLANGEPITGTVLAQGLNTYSELEGYVKYVRLVIQKHNLGRYDKQFEHVK